MVSTREGQKEKELKDVGEKAWKQTMVEWKQERDKWEGACKRLREGGCRKKPRKADVVLAATPGEGGDEQGDGHGGGTHSKGADSDDETMLTTTLGETTMGIMTKTRVAQTITWTKMVPRMRTVMKMRTTASLGMAMAMAMPASELPASEHRRQFVLILP